MARQSKLSNKFVSLLVSITFLLTQFVIDVRPAHSALPQTLPLPEPNEITIPEAYGRITETFKGDSGKLVFHIQDLHTNPEAQLNASKIIEHLINTYGVKLLTIEGEAGPIDPEWLANVSLIKLINDKMAEIFLNSGEMTGEEYLYVTQYPKYRDVTFWGIENKDSYWKNREVFNRMHPKIRENLRLCDSIKGSLDKLKKAIYPEQAAELDEKRTSYETRELEVKDYTSYLVDLAKQKGVDISKYENFSILAKLVDIQERLEFSKVDKERTFLFDALGKVLSEEQAKQMMENVKAHNEGKSTAIEFYTYLKGLAVDNGIDFAQYPNINTYMEYISTSDQLNNNELFKELDQVEDALVSSLLTTDEQKRLARLSKMLNIMKKFFDINLSNEDLDYYEKNKAEFKVQTFTDFIKEKAKQYNIRYSLDPAISQLDKTLNDQDEFYKVVLVRDEAMVNNTIKKMDETGTNVTIQPIGGFHTKGMAKMYKERGISYVVISPHVTKEFDEENYRNILLNKKKSVKELFEEFRKMLRPPQGSNVISKSDAVAMAVYLAEDMFKPEMSDEEAVRAAIRTINPAFIDKAADVPELREVVAAIRNEEPEVTFDGLTQPEKDYYQSLGIDLSDVVFVTGFGLAAAAIYDHVRKVRRVHRIWGLAGIVNQKMGGDIIGKRSNRATQHYLDVHEALHRTLSDETAVLEAEMAKLLELPIEKRREIADGLYDLMLPMQSHLASRAYTDFVRASVNENRETAEKNMRAMIPFVVEASRQIVGTVERQEKETIAKAVIEGDAFARIAQQQDVKIPAGISAITFDVGTLLGAKGPRDLAGLGAIADKLLGKTIFIVNTNGGLISDAEIEGLLGLRGSGINYRIIAEANISEAGSAQQFVILKRNMEKFEAIVKGKRPIIIDLSEEQEGKMPPAVVSIYSILLTLGLVFDVDVLGDLAQYIIQGAAGEDYSAVISAQPARTFGEQYQKFLLERIQR